MIELFPKHKRQMLLAIGVFLAAMVVVYVLQPSLNPALLIVLALLGIAVIVFMQNLAAAGEHDLLLNRLYNQLDAEGFLKAYEPLLNIRPHNSNLYLMVRLHASNAYCALGRFDDAERLLSSTCTDAKKPEQALLAQFAVASNLCYCAEQRNDLPAARQYMEQLLASKKALVALQEKKPEKKRIAFSTEVNELCLRLLETGKTDIPALRANVQKNNQQLQRITTSLWIARAYLAENNRHEAENLLEKIARLAPHLYPGQSAATLLAELPPKPENLPSDEKKQSKKK